MKTCSLVIVCQPSEKEQGWIDEFFAQPTARRFNFVIITNTEAIYPNGMREQFTENISRRLSLKKNLGIERILRFNDPYCLVVHADTYPMDSFFDVLQEIEIGEREMIAPLGLWFNPETAQTQEGITWFNHQGHPPDESFVPGHTYISGAAILGPTQLFREFPWNPIWNWQCGEDIRYSRLLEEHGVTLRYEPRLIVEMKESQ